MRQATGNAKSAESSTAFLRNQRTATALGHTLQKQMIDLLVSNARKVSAQKAHIAITGIFHSAHYDKEQSKAGNTSTFVHLSKDG